MRKLAMAGLMCAVMLGGVGCGTILNGSVPQELRGEIDALALVCDVIFFGVLGVVIDVATGGLWKRKVEKGD